MRKVISVLSLSYLSSVYAMDNAAPNDAANVAQEVPDPQQAKTIDFQAVEQLYGTYKQNPTPVVRTQI